MLKTDFLVHCVTHFRNFLSYTTSIGVLPILVFTLAGLPFLPSTAAAKTYEFNQKLSIEIQTPDGLKSASSVMSISYRPAWLKQPAAGFDQPTIRLTGEAVTLEIQPGRYLFVLLKGLPYPWEVFFPNVSPEEVVKELEKSSEIRELKPAQYPMLVTFVDINDPTTVKQVKPENLAEYFGPGVSLKIITLGITDEQMTRGKVDRILSWFGKADYLVPPNKLPQLAKDRKPIQNVNKFDFITGDLWVQK